MRRKFTYYIYILTNMNNTTFYIGVTNNIFKRSFEHRVGINEGFTKKYKLKKLIYLEEYSDIKEAIAREKQLKNWHREWKLNLIKKVNPNFNDLSIIG
ncbi:MAG: GIY-YIG nuclease family protein [Candidatus Levybacteria bacterium]|nr:GIY-YIG nuclease family protein [Candidatus Levybacteria bacterium]